MLTFEGVLSDLDGTLTESEKLLFEAWVELAARAGKDFSTMDYGLIIGLPDADCCRKVSDHFGLAKDPAQWHREYLDILRDIDVRLTMRPGADVLLERLKNLGLPMAIVTSADSDHAWRSLNRFNFGPYFRAVVTADTPSLTARKPDPAPYILGASFIGVPPDRCVAFEDSPAGIKSARAAGCFVIGCPHAQSPSKDLGEAHMLLENLADFRPEMVIIPK